MFIINNKKVLKTFIVINKNGCFLLGKIRGNGGFDWRHISSIKYFFWCREKISFKIKIIFLTLI